MPLSDSVAVERRMRMPRSVWLGGYALLMAGLLSGCHSHAGSTHMHPTLGPPRIQSVTVVQPPARGRFDYVVHLVGVDQGAMRPARRLAHRLNRAKKAVGKRCAVKQVVDLYQHRLGSLPNGRDQISFTMGVYCKKASKSERRLY